MKDAIIADVLAKYLDQPRDYCNTHTALNILTEFDSPRLFEIGMRLLDSPEQQDTNNQLKFQAAFCVARFGAKGTEALLSRLNSPTPGIRAAAVAALREACDKGATDAVRKLINDPDEQVREQAAMTLRFLEHPPAEVSSEDIAAVSESLMYSLRVLGLKLPESNEEVE